MRRTGTPRSFLRLPTMDAHRLDPIVVPTVKANIKDSFFRDFRKSLVVSRPLEPFSSLTACFRDPNNPTVSG
ncbi:hypothetical protein ABIC60_003615 [Phyllobacterium ifriqiyense]